MCVYISKRERERERAPKAQAVSVERARARVCVCVCKRKRESPVWDKLTLHVCLREKGECNTAWEERGWRRGRGELDAQTRKGTDLTHYTCLLSIILSECWSSMAKVHWPAQYPCDPFDLSSIPPLMHHPPPSLPPPPPPKPPKARRPRVETPAPSSSQLAASYRAECWCDAFKLRPETEEA